VNVSAALDCFGEAANSGCSRIVYASTLHVYGRVPVPMREDGQKEPVSLYGTSKLFLEQSAEIFARHTGLPCVGMRFANVYGPGESGKGKMASQVLQIAQQMHAGNPKVFSPGTQERDFVYVDDAIRTILAAAEYGRSAIFNCGSGEGTAFNTLIALLNESLGLARTPEYIPEPPQYLARVVLDVSKARTELGHDPRCIREGLKTYFESGELKK
jgi:ADP-L-glycero-D-manno-heptose 6-epimerase